MKKLFPGGAVLCILGLATTAFAEPLILIGEDTPNTPNYFTVNFPPELGGPQTADIDSTKLILQVDPEAGTASVLAYHQHVSPLLLGPFSTGAITVKLAGPSVGVTDLPGQDQFDSGTFDTSESFNIFFAGDLSGFGLQSPFFALSNTSGVVTFRTATRGTIDLMWEGTGEIPNPQNPEEPFTFTYQCFVNTQFSVATSCEEVASVEARCNASRLSLLVNLADASQDGGVAALTVDGEPFALPIVGNKAFFAVRNPPATPVVLLVSDEDSCVPPVTPVCE